MIIHRFFVRMKSQQIEKNEVSHYREKWIYQNNSIDDQLKENVFSNRYSSIIIHFQRLFIEFPRIFLLNLICLDFWSLREFILWHWCSFEDDHYLIDEFPLINKKHSSDLVEVFLFQNLHHSNNMMEWALKWSADWYQITK